MLLHTFHERSTYLGEGTVENPWLTPGTDYDYYVDAGGEISASGTFTTAVSANDDFSFVAYGDVQRYDPDYDPDIAIPLYIKTIKML